MKTIKIAIFSLVALFIGAAIVTSCSKDETDKGMSKNAKVNTYLKSFYKKEFQLGKSLDSRVPKPSTGTSKSEEYQNIIITEVFVGEDTRARGYILTEKGSNDFLYFIDVDRVNYKMTTEKIDVNQTQTFENIEQLTKYTSTNEFDFIKITDDLIKENSANEANKFWGWGPVMHDGPCENGRKKLYRNYYVFWMNTGIQQDEPDPHTGGAMFEPCGPSVLGED